MLQGFYTAARTSQMAAWDNGNFAPMCMPLDDDLTQLIVHFASLPLADAVSIHCPERMWKTTRPMTNWQTKTYHASARVSTMLKPAGIGKCCA